MIIKKYPHVFHEKFIDQGLFNNIYSQVCSRCFGYGLPTTSMIPMADNLNHNCLDVTHEIINQDIHLEGFSNQSYYKMQKSMNDYSILFQDNFQLLNKED